MIRKNISELDCLFIKEEDRLYTITLKPIEAEQFKNENGGKIIRLSGNRDLNEVDNQAGFGTLLERPKQCCFVCGRAMGKV